jgi:hypothetical protein
MLAHLKSHWVLPPAVRPFVSKEIDASRGTGFDGNFVQMIL